MTSSPPPTPPQNKFSGGGEKGRFHSRHVATHLDAGKLVNSMDGARAG